MPQTLPLFPLGTVLLPGLVLPLHVFEERYRALVRDLLELPEPDRVFGVVAIRSGHEVGADGVRALHEVGCTAQVRQVEQAADGRFGLLTVGRTRFALRAVDRTRHPYLVGEVDLLQEGPAAGGDAETLALVTAVQEAFRGYQQALATARGDLSDVPELPDEPRTLSYLVAAAAVVDLDARQALLAAPDETARLRAELALLGRETALLDRVAAVPAPELRHTPQSLN